MDQNQFERDAEEILQELKNVDGHSYVKNLASWKSGSAKFNSIKIRLAEFGLVKITQDGSVLTLTEKGWQFTTFKEASDQIAEEKRLQREQIESIISTNKSIEAINVSTEKFYSKQKEYLKTQEKLTWVIASATALYTLFAILTFFQGCHK
ncbi:MAG: hypothetical protein ACTHJN_20275 [Ginsengibacter sp.]